MNVAQINESYELRDERLGFIPENFSRGVIDTSTGLEDNVKPWRWGSIIVKIPLWRFTSPKAEVISTKPVLVKISKGESLFFAENENLGIFATGDSRNEAISAFNEHLIHFHYHYKHLDWNKATGEAQRLKKIYEDLFKEIRHES